VNRYLVDENLPASLHSVVAHVTHVSNLGQRLTDTEIWNHAVKHNLVIDTKDADFADRMMANDPPPQVVHLRIGNMRLHELTSFINSVWPTVESMLFTNKLIGVYPDRIEAIASNQLLR
jgi:predicted nuclease of predicted toxin-antitoxin system